MTNVRAVLFAAVLLVLASCSATPRAIASPAPTATVTVTAQPTTAKVTPTPTPKPAAPKPTIGDGKVVVGDDIPAGTYDVRGAPSDCYWEIDRHGTSTIVDNSFGTGGHMVVTLKVGQDFESEGCGTWVKK